MHNEFYNESFIMHIGIKRRSGRYPSGSGEHPFQSAEEFMDYVSSDYVPQPHIKAMFDEGHLSGNYVDKIHDYFRKNGGLRTRICFELISLFKNNHKKIEKEDE